MREEKIRNLWQLVLTVLINLLLLFFAGNVSSYAEKLGENGERVLFLQQELARRGYYGGACDGSFSPSVRSAVKHLQLDNSVEATGEANYEVFELLGLDASHGAGYFDCETELLARLAQWCCTAKGYDGRLRFCKSVVARLDSPDYPDTLAENLLSGEFGSFASALTDIRPDTDSLRAARDALDGF